MRRILLCLVLCLATGALAQSAPVRSGDYDAFWLWAGVAGRPELDKAACLYLLQGEISPPRPQGTPAVLHAMSGASPGPHQAPIYLVYRVRTLDWSPVIMAQIKARLEHWHSQPGAIIGLQLDFDAGTKHLEPYRSFLARVRGDLPSQYRLSITGLMDWASQARLEDLEALSGVVDEIVFQTYRGRATVADIDAYLARLDRLTIPFKLGLAEGAEWNPSPTLAGKPNFKGYVVFLRN